jgi:integrase
MATSALDVGARLGRQALVEKPVYVADDSDLDSSFFPNGALSAASPQRTFHSQYLIWIDELKNRAYDPVAQSTLANFVSCAKTILSVVGPSTPLESFKNQAMAQFVRDVKKFNWAPATLSQHVLVIKLIIASATDLEGEQLFPRTWRRRLINAPRVERSKQKTPVLTKDDVEKLIREADTQQDKTLYAFLAGSGLRISEAQSVRVSGNNSQTSWDQVKSVVVVRNSCFRNKETGRTKTIAGQRTVFLHSDLNQALIAFAAHKERENGSFLFQSKPDQPIRLSTVRDRMAKRIPGAAPHAARRFYISWLRKCRVLEEIIRDQVGHADESITDGYSFQDETTVRAAIEAASLGFNLA